MNSALRTAARTLAARLRRMPMAAALAPFAAGLLFFDRFGMPDVALWVLLVVLMAAAARYAHRRAALWCMAAALFIFGGVVQQLHRQPADIPADRLAVMDMKVVDAPLKHYGSRTMMPVRIEGFDDGDGLQSRSALALLYADRSLQLECGDRITALAMLRPFVADTLSPERSSYARLMQRRGYAGRLSVTAADTLGIVRGTSRHTLHALAVGRFARLNLAPEVLAAAAAIGTGDRSRITPELREAYSRSGVSHILALSGLHIGIIFFVANLLFRPLAIFRHGQIAACAAVAVAIWLYAAACGFPPSVVRAAAMFTMLQLSAAFTVHYSPANVLAATAFFILVFDPDALFDIGFQLSFAAVAAITTIGVPLFIALRDKHIAEKFLWNTLIIGAVSFAATAPLVLHTFGQVSFAGFFINPVVLLCAGVIVTVSALWVMMPLPCIMPAVEWILESATGIQNEVVRHFASVGWLSVDARLSSGATMAIYAAAGILYAAGYLYKNREYDRRF